jgi:diadenylate cyclase
MSPLFENFNWLNFLDVFLVAVLIYQLYKIIKGTVAIRIFIGIFAIYLFWKLVELLHMELLSEILGQFIGVGVIALIIVFQQELRRFLILIGTTSFIENKGTLRRLLKWAKQNDDDRQLDIKAIISACESMSSSKTGALIVFERAQNLQLVTSTGDELNAKVSAKLLETIFFKNSPLHDGAVVIVHNKIKAARCVLPATEGKNFPEDLGMRHRAAVGITEISDAVAISVSEQTGEISVAKDGNLKKNLTSGELKDYLFKNIAEI